MKTREEIQKDINKIEKDIFKKKMEIFRLELQIFLTVIFLIFVFHFVDILLGREAMWVVVALIVGANLYGILKK